jgi:5-oxoprolinase (ATP-hydrolysing)
VIKVKITVDKANREATVDFTGTSRMAEEQFQRARTGDARRRALCLPADGRGNIPMNAGCLGRSTSSSRTAAC